PFNPVHHRPEINSLGRRRGRRRTLADLDSQSDGDTAPERQCQTFHQRVRHALSLFHSGLPSVLQKPTSTLVFQPLSKLFSLAATDIITAEVGFRASVKQRCSLFVLSVLSQTKFSI